MTLLLGCQGDKTAAPVLTPQEIDNIDLPTSFGQSLELAFQANPEQTARRILRAHDGFSRVGPVTTKTVKDYLRLEASTHRARFFTDILAIDLNGDQLITPAEFDVLPTVPNGYKKAMRLDALFGYDENLDGYISVDEALEFAGYLSDLRAKTEMHPIGRYLMLFDLNGDGKVVRPEVVKALRDYLSDTRNTEPPLKRQARLR